MEYHRRAISKLVTAIIVVVIIVIAGVSVSLYTLSTSSTSTSSTSTSSTSTSSTSTSSLVPTTSTSTTSSNALAPIKLGLVVSLTGANDVEGIPLLQAVKLWVNQTNSQGGLLGHQVVLDYYDDQSNPTLTAQLVTKLFTVDHVTLCMGQVGTPVTAALAPLAKQYNYVCPTGGTSPDFYPPGNRWIFGYDASFSQNYTLPYFNYLTSLPQNERPQRLALIYPSDNDFGVGCAQGARVYAAQDNFSLVVDQGYPSSTTDFSSLVSLMKSENVQAVVGCTYITDAFAATKAMAQFGFNPSSIYETVGAGVPGFPNATGNAQNGILTEAFWAPDLNLSSSAAFENAFVRAYGSPPSLFSAAVGYAGLQVLKDAIDAVGSFNQTAIGVYIGTHSFNTIVGTFNYNNGLNGMPNPVLYMQQWHNDSLVTINNPSQIVYPKPPFA